jgi:hypothetical protein
MKKIILAVLILVATITSTSFAFGPDKKMTRAEKKEAKLKAKKAAEKNSKRVEKIKNNKAE